MASLSLYALSDDAVHAIIAMLPDESLFLSLVCKRFWKFNKVVHSRFGHSVTPLRRVFSSESRLREAMHSASVAWKLCRKVSLVANGVAVWNTFATRSAFSEGPVSVLRKVRPDWLNERINLHYICRYNRVDLLEHVVSAARGNLFDHVGGILRRMSTSPDEKFNSLTSLIQVEQTTKEFVESVVIPASIGGAIDVLVWFMNGIQMRQLLAPTLWNRAFDGKRSEKTACYVGKIACGAACAPNAKEVLEFVVDQVVACTGNPRNEVCQEVALMVVASTANGSTESALEWARAHGDSLTSLMSKFNSPDGSPAVCMEIGSVNDATASMFDARSPEAYACIKREVAKGGWMRAAFESLDFRQSFPFFVLARVIPRDLHDNKDDILVLAACLHDCVLEWATLGCSRDVCNEIKRGLFDLVNISVVEAHQLLVNLLRAAASLPPREATKVREMLTQYFKGASFAECVMHSAVYLGMHGVVESVTRLDVHPTRTSAAFAESLATAASAAGSERVIAVLAEHGVDFDVRCAVLAAERGNASVLKAIMQTRPMVCEKVGEAALLSRHGPTVEIAFLSGCFGRSDSKRRAKRIMEDWDGERSIKRRRVLPRSFSDKTKSILDAEPRA